MESQGSDKGVSLKVPSHPPPKKGKGRTNKTMETQDLNRTRGQKRVNFKSLISTRTNIKSQPVLSGVPATRLPGDQGQLRTNETEGKQRLLTAVLNVI